VVVYAGIDEAGYGPLLGPLTVGCTWFVLPEDEPDAGAPPMWSRLRRVVTRHLGDARKRLVVADSKKVKRPNQGPVHPLTDLERSVLAFLAADARSEEPIADDVGLHARLGGDATCGFDAPWYAGPPLALPSSPLEVAGLGIDANRLRRALPRGGVEVHGLACEIMEPDELNARVALTRNKAEASFGLVGRHVERLLRAFGEHGPRIVIDRQGGRYRYREALHALFPDASIRVLDERDGWSRYRLDLSDGRRHAVLTFLEGAEDRHFPVALASMTAKYVRELRMARLNRYFTACLPGLVPTAGYRNDAQRFLRDVEVVIRRERLERRHLIRER